MEDLLKNDTQTLSSTLQTETSCSVSCEKQIYDLKQLLEISRSLCTTLELDKLIESILYIAMAQMRVLGAGVFLKRESEADCYCLGLNFTGFEKKVCSSLKINADCALANFLKETDIAYTVEDLRRILGDSKELETIASVKPTLIVPLNLKKHLIGIMVLGERICLADASPSYSFYEKEEIVMLASLAAVAISNAFLLDQSSTDMMTHLKLRHYFFNILSDRMELARVHGESISVMMIDIDHFKKFNDRYGHACGDFVLEKVAGLIKDSIRPDDVASRYGGEEFTVMLLDADIKKSMKVAERILSKISGSVFCYESKKLKVSVSIGVAVFNPEEHNAETPEEIVKLADQAMYLSKKNGRNTVSNAKSLLKIPEEKGKKTHEHHKKAV